MDIIIGKERRELFSKGKIYDCVIRDNEHLQVNYKIYGDEYSKGIFLDKDKNLICHVQI